MTDPDDALRRAREAGPVAASEIGPIAVGHEAVRTVLREPKLRPSFSYFLERLGITSGAFYEWMKASPLDMDGGDHRRWRQMVLRAFTPHSVERLRPFLRRESERLTERFAERGHAEFIDEFARTLPSLGLCELIGVPLDERARFGAWSDVIGLGFSPTLINAHIHDIDRVLLELLAYVRRLIERRRAEPRDDLVSRLALAATEEGLDSELVHGSVAGLVFAGHETTKNQLGWMVTVLSEFPEQWDAVARDPARAKDVVEEVLRFRSTVTYVARVATSDVELFGTRIWTGSSVLTSLWSANRDANVFPVSDGFDPDANRDAVQMAFGAGAHYCLGAALARAELQESLITLSARLHCPVLEPGAEFLPAFGTCGPRKLPIRVRARG